MSKAHADIEAHLGFSEKFRKQLEAHQHETAQLLSDMEQLQGEVRDLLNENEQLHAECDAKGARIAELEATIAELEARPVSITAGKYFENYNVAHQVVTLQPRTAKRLKSKSKIIDTNQLDIWKDNPAISW